MSGVRDWRHLPSGRYSALIIGLVNMSPKQRIDVMIEPAQLAQLRELQARTGATVSEIIRRAIERYLESEAGRKTSKKKR